MTPAKRLAEQLGLKPAFETARMYTGPDPAFDRAGLFGVTSFELGYFIRTARFQRVSCHERAGCARSK